MGYITRPGAEEDMNETFHSDFKKAILEELSETMKSIRARTGELPVNDEESAVAAEIVSHSEQLVFSLIDYMISSMNKKMVLENWEQAVALSAEKISGLMCVIIEEL